MDGRYMGAELVETYSRRTTVFDELLVRASPAKIVARKDIADFRQRTMDYD